MGGTQGRIQDYFSEGGYRIFFFGGGGTKNGTPPQKKKELSFFSLIHWKEWNN